MHVWAMRMVLGACVLLVLGVLLSADEQTPLTAEQRETLRAELQRRQQEDQQARKALIQWMTEQGGSGLPESQSLDPARQQAFQQLTAKLGKIDAENTRWLKEVVATHGWPTISLVGQENASSAWLLLQHADADPQFQRHCLDLMKALPKDEVSQRDLAYLTDRVLLAEGKKQLYGTQFSMVNDQWKPRPLEDEDNVDQRRAAVGLPPLREYVEQLKQVYGAAKAKRDADRAKESQ